MNAQNLNEKKNEWASTGKSVVDRAISEVKNIDPQEIRKTATELTTRVRDVSAQTYDDVISYVRRNPVSSALGLAAFGFVAGVITASMRKSA